MKKMSIYQTVVCALMAAVMCVLGPISVPIGPVPVSFTMLVIYFAIYLTGTKFAVISYGIYFLLGLVGVPVFSGYTGGIAKVLGPTGGYLIGFFFTAIIGGIFVSKFPLQNIKHRAMQLLGFILGLSVAYVFGTAWFAVLMKCGVLYAFSICVLPFLLADVIKMIIAILIGGEIRKRLVAAGLDVNKDIEN